MKNDQNDGNARPPVKLSELISRRQIRPLDRVSHPNIGLHFATKCVPSFANNWLFLTGNEGASKGIDLALRKFREKWAENRHFNGFWAEESISLWFFHLVGVECANCMAMFVYNFKFPAGGTVV